MKAKPGYEEQALKRDPIKLLELLRDIAQSFDAAKHETMAIIESDVKFYLGFQGKTASIDECATLFRSRLDTIKAHGGKSGYHPAQQLRILEREIKARGWDDAGYANLGSEEKIVFDTEVMKLARGEYFACLFVRQTDTGRYGELKKTIINDYLRGGPDCPKTLEGAVTLFKNYIPTAAERQTQKRTTTLPSTTEEVAFSQPAGPNTDTRACYSCGETGHLVKDCKKVKNEDKVAIFRRGDAAWRASRPDRQTAPRAPPQTTSTNNKTAAAANLDPGSSISKPGATKFQSYRNHHSRNTHDMRRSLHPATEPRSKTSKRSASWRRTMSAAAASI